MFAENLSETMEKTQNTSLAFALGVCDEKRENDLVALCIKLSAKNEYCSEILKELMCSDINSKELIFCSFLCGRMQEMDAETAQAFVLKHCTARVFEEFKNQLSNNK